MHRAPDLMRESKINLGFVSKLNGDEYNGRSIEIPASGGFLLAKRTPSHQALYREGKEAEFFADVRELASKCKHYLVDERAREEIAQSGYLRTRTSQYTLTRRMRDASLTMAQLLQMRSSNPIV